MVYLHNLREIEWTIRRRQNYTLYRWPCRTETHSVTVCAPTHNLAYRPVNVGVMELEPGEAQNQGVLQGQRLCAEGNLSENLTIQG